MTSTAYFPSFHPDWLTPERAAIENGMPVEMLEQAIQARDVPVRIACGARVVSRAEAQAWALMKKAELRGCDECED